MDPLHLSSIAARVPRGLRRVIIGDIVAVCWHMTLEELV
jgi:hypothetical protein